TPVLLAVVVTLRQADGSRTRALANRGTQPAFTALTGQQLAKPPLRVHQPGVGSLLQQVERLLAVTLLQGTQAGQVVIGAVGLRRTRQHQAGSQAQPFHCCSSCSVNSPSNSIDDR